MIKKECFTTEWIEQIASELHYNDKNLIEKVIRALSLLEMLVKAGCPLVFKGGTALMLILGKSAHRLSIDIDVICPPGTNIEDYLKSFADFGFINLELVERKQRDDADIPKSHSKFFYQIAYRNDTDAQSYILLDVLYEDIHYFQTRQIAIDCPFIRLEGEPLMVTVPSAEDILGDKLTAFAPNTTGIPYYKNGRSCSMEIAKQLYDVGRLFENVSGLQITAKAFRKIAVVELSYRSLGTDIGQVFNDIRQTALCISTRGKSGEGDFNLIQDGIIRVKSFMYKQRYLIDNAIIDAARAAYLATLIEKGVTEVERYSNNPVDIKKTVLKALCAAGVMLLGMTLPAGAQTSSGDVKGFKYEANLMVGVMQMAYDSDEFPSRHYYRKELSDFYETYTGDPGFSAFYTADFNVYLTKWLKVGASAGYAKAWANVFDPRGYKKIGEKTLNDYSLLGQAKFTFINRQLFRMYAGIGAGASVWAGKDRGETYSKILPAVEFIPLGFQWMDHKIYTTLEIVAGTRMGGVRGGLGYRF